VMFTAPINRNVGDSAPESLKPTAGTLRDPGGVWARLVGQRPMDSSDSRPLAHDIFDNCDIFDSAAMAS
jgi:hypothetical protein